MKWFTLCLLPALISATDFVHFTQPLNSTIWQAGQTVVIQWQAATSQPLSNNPVIVNLMYGPASSLALIGPLGWAEASAGTLSVQLPTSLYSGQNYSVVIQPNSYSDQFTINNTAKPLGSGNPDSVSLPQLTNVPSATSAAATAAELSACMAAGVAGIVAMAMQHL